MADPADPTHIFYLFEGNIHSFRQIFIDGRKHLAGSGSHLVRRFDRHLGWRHAGGRHHRVQRQVLVRFRGHPHSEQLHTIERYTRPDLGTLDIETQIIDPVAYTKPFTINFTATLRPGEELMEYICQENQQDAQHLQGPAGPAER